MGLKVKSPATIYLGSAVDPGSGGGGGGGQDEDLSKYFVKVFDYDGTLLDYKRLNNGEKYKLPETTPQHEGLVFQEWSCTAPIIDGEVTVDDNNIMIGAIYDTASGKDEFDFEIIEKITTFDVTLNFAGERDWGDGTVDSLKTHTYAKAGKYTVKLNSGYLQTDYAFGQSQSAHNKYCTAIRLHSSLSMSWSYSFCFSYCDNLETVTIKSLSSAYQYSFAGNKSLKCLIIPSNFSSFGYIGFASDNTCMNTLLIPYGVTDFKKGVNNDAWLKNFVFPDSVTTIGDDVLGSGKMEEVIIPKNVTTIGAGVLYSTNNIKKLVVKSSAITTISGNTFYCSNSPTDGHTNIDFNNITSTENIFYNCNNISKYIVPEHITSFGGLAGNQWLEEIVFHDNITSIKGICYSYNITKLVFPKKLNLIKEQSLRSLSCCMEYDFSNCEAIPTLESNVFNDIRDFAKIYVPWDLYKSWKTNVNWSNVATHIDTKNTANVNFVSSSEDFSSYIDGEPVSNSGVIIKGSTINYICHDNVSNTITYGTYNGIQENSVVDINVDFSNSKKISLSLGVNDLDVWFNCDDILFKATEDNGNYYINAVGSGKTIKYHISGGDSYIDQDGTIITTGSDITESITLSQCTTQSYTRPNLTANGTIGGNDFAVSAPASSSSYPAWKAVDNSTSSYWLAPTSDGLKYRDYLLYFPSEIKISQIVLLSGTTTNNQPSAIKLQASFDGVIYKDIEITYSGSQTRTIVLTNNEYFKYYKLLLKNASTSYSLYGYDIAITALEKVPV